MSDPAPQDPAIRALTLAALLAATVLASPPASAQGGLILYGAAAEDGFEDTSNSRLYIIDPETAVATEVGSIGFDNIYGLALDRDDRLVGTARDDFVEEGGLVERSILVRIDRQTGAGTFVGPVDDNAERPAGSRGQEKCGRMDDLAFEAQNSTLWAMGTRCRAVNNSSFDDTAVYTINTDTGRGAGRQREGGLPAFTNYTGDPNAMAWDPKTGLFYFASGLDFILLERFFSCARPADCPVVGELSAGMRAMDVDPLTGVLYGARQAGNGAFLVTIDTSDCTEPNPTACGTDTAIGLIVDEDNTPLAMDALAFRAPSGCPAAPYGPCRQSQEKGGKLSLSGKKGKLSWNWTGAGTSLDSFGDPMTDTEYRVCITDFSDITVPSLVDSMFVPAGEDWKGVTNGFTYKSKDGDPDGITRVRLRADLRPGKATVRVRGKGVDLSLPYRQNTRTVIQLINGVGECWDSEFLFPAKKNRDDRFNDRE